METKFIIEHLERDSHDGGVVAAGWRMILTDDKYTAVAYGSVGFEPDSSKSNFIRFEDLSEEIVVKWVRDQLGTARIAALEDGLVKQIDNQKAPKIISGLPW